MIIGIVSGDITSPSNSGDIIIGMNTSLGEVTGIGRKFVSSIKTLYPIDRGSVLSFKFDERRNLHMLVCHHLEADGWKDADMHVRFGLDYLWHTEAALKKFSIVQIGTGRIGKRDGANSTAILTAMATSHLPVELFVHEQLTTVGLDNGMYMPPMEVYRAWHPVYGEELMTA